jgi:putative transposase
MTMLIGNGIAISMDSKGAWRNNVFLERLWRALKHEEVYLCAYAGVAEAQASIARYLTLYSRRWSYQGLVGEGRLNPSSFRERM